MQNVAGILEKRSGGHGMVACDMNSQIHFMFWHTSSLPGNPEALLFDSSIKIIIVMINF